MHNEHVVRVETLFLDAGGREVDVVFVLDGDPTAGALVGGLASCQSSLVVESGGTDRHLVAGYILAICSE